MDMRKPATPPPSKMSPDNSKQSSLLQLIKEPCGLLADIDSLLATDIADLRDGVRLATQLLRRQLHYSRGCSKSAFRDTQNPKQRIEASIPRDQADRLRNEVRSLKAEEDYLRQSGQTSSPRALELDAEFGEAANEASGDPELKRRADGNQRRLDELEAEILILALANAETMKRSIRRLILGRWVSEAKEEDVIA